MIVIFIYKATPLKFFEGFNFFWKEKSFQIANIPIIMNKPVASFKGDVAAKVFVLAEFRI